MDVHGKGKNVNLRIECITRGMLANVPDLLLDLLEIAAYIYCADQRLSRGTAQLTNFGENWRRDLHFVIPVHDLADRIGVADQSLRTQLTRLRDALEPLTVSLCLVLDQDSFVENRPRVGYRLNPALRELSLADIRTTGPTKKP